MLRFTVNGRTFTLDGVVSDEFAQWFLYWDGQEASTSYLFSPGAAIAWAIDIAISL